MSTKLSEAMFVFTPRKGEHGRDVMSELINNPQVIGFCNQFEGKRIMIHLKEKPEKNTKESLYNFYHRVVLDVAIQCFSDDGFVAVDKVKADYMLKAECAKIEEYNPKTGELIIFLEDKGNMSASRLHKYVLDCVTWLEVERGYLVPDSFEFKNPGFKQIK